MAVGATAVSASRSAPTCVIAEALALQPAAERVELLLRRRERVVDLLVGEVLVASAPRPRSARRASPCRGSAARTGASARRFAGCLPTSFALPLATVSGTCPVSTALPWSSRSGHAVESVERDDLSTGDAAVSRCRVVPLRAACEPEHPHDDEGSDSDDYRSGAAQRAENPHTSPFQWIA